MIMFKRNFKKNVKDELMRDERFIENLKTLIEIVIDLNDKLYERAIKRRYLKQQTERKKYQIQQRERQIKFETSRVKRRSNETIFMKFDTKLFRKFKNKKKTNEQEKKNGVLSI